MSTNGSALNDINSMSEAELRAALVAAQAEIAKVKAKAKLVFSGEDSPETWMVDHAEEFDGYLRAGPGARNPGSETVSTEVTDNKARPSVTHDGKTFRIRVILEREKE